MDLMVSVTGGDKASGAGLFAPLNRAFDLVDGHQRPSSVVDSDDLRVRRERPSSPFVTDSARESPAGN